MGSEKTSALEGVEGRLKNLKLSDAERKGIKFGKKQACSPMMSKLQAVGKLFSGRPAKAEYLGRTLGSVWSPFTGVECKDLGRNRFLFLFHEETGKNKALNEGPWTFNKDLLVMEDFAPSKTIDEYEFKKIPIWVRAYGIPMGMMSKETGKLIGEQIGQFLEVGLDDNENAMGEFMRIKVRKDITTPLMRFMAQEIESDDEDHDQRYEETMGTEDEKKHHEKEDKVISFKYEYLPDFCYYCGIIGHTEKACPTRNWREENRQYGPWLRAIIYKGSSSEERSKISGDHAVFWRSNSGGSRGSKQGSDGPTWRKSLPTIDDEDKTKRGEERELTRSLKVIQEVDQTGSMGDKKLMFQDKEQITENEANIQRPDKTESEHPKNEISVVKEKLQGIKECSDMKSGNIVKQGTFKRRQRNHDKHQTENQHNQGDLKKRSADMMEVDGETGWLKKARMEVDSVTKGEEKEGNAKSEILNAGLQGQPGEAK
ncbi:hypothetical protein ACQ4PT_061708 [Festuca glaucescens]